MIERLPFNTDTVRQINDHVQERLAEVEANFANEAYPPDKPRQIDIKIVFEPDRADPTEMVTKIFSESKFPKRYGKKVNTALKNGRILVEVGPEDAPLFPEEPGDGARKFKTLREAVTMSVVKAGGES